MNAVILAVALLGAGPHWSIAPDGSVIATAPSEKPYWSIASDGSVIAAAPPEEPSLVEIVIEEPSLVEIVIEEPPTVSVVRKPGPRHPWPHAGCKMCIGNHCVLRHGYNRSYLDSIGSEQFGVLHDNDHNTPGFQHDNKPSGTGCYGGAGPSRSRWRPFWRWRR